MTIKRYTLLNEYYIQDNKTNKKLSQKQILYQLNHQERIIQMKTDLIENLVKQNTRIQENNIPEDIQKICKKYNIPIESLAGTLEEYILNDNDGYMGYSKCDDCKHNFEIKKIKT